MKQTNKSNFRLKTHRYRMLTEPTQSSTPAKGPTRMKFFKKQKQIPLMNDDFHIRKVIHEETFILKKHTIMKVKVSITDKFFYISLENTRIDSHYKIRLLLDTGIAIYQKLKQLKKTFREHIFQNQVKSWYFSAPFPPWERKFYFMTIHPSKVREQNTDVQQEDDFISNEIKKIDKTYLIFGNNPFPN